MDRLCYQKKFLEITVKMALYIFIATEVKDSLSNVQQIKPLITGTNSPANHLKWYCCVNNVIR